MSREDPQIGEKVQFSKVLIRMEVAENPDDYHTNWARRWVPFEPRDLRGRGRIPTNKGILVGIRFLKNGHIETSDLLSQSSEFRETETVKAYLVAYDLHRKPVFVRPEDISFLEGR